jgi:hypothetical protein
MRQVIWLIIAAVAILAYILYQSRRVSNDLDVEPHAAEEIEKAKHR